MYSRQVTQALRPGVGNMGVTLIEATAREVRKAIGLRIIEPSGSGISSTRKSISTESLQAVHCVL